MQSKDSLESHVTEHFRLSGVYWGLTALYLMGRLDIMDGAAIVDWVSAQHCQGLKSIVSATPRFLHHARVRQRYMLHSSQLMLLVACRCSSVNIHQEALEAVNGMTLICCTL